MARLEGVWQEAVFALYLAEGKIEPEQAEQGGKPSDGDDASGGGAGKIFFALLALRERRADRGIIYCTPSRVSY
jgi:hypothetical protein